MTKIMFLPFTGHPRREWLAVVLYTMVLLTQLIKQTKIMKPEKQKQVDQFVEAINLKLKLDPNNDATKGLEKQIRKIAKHLVRDIQAVTKKKISKEKKRLRQEIKRQSRESRIVAARQILSGRLYQVNVAQ
jgi:uncharacterized protein YhaN